MKRLWTIVFLAASSTFCAQSTSRDTMYIQTSALCQDCKNRIESTLNFQKGVKFASLDLETKIALVIYKPKRTTPFKLRKALSNVGYDADEIKADPKAILLLPKCCQPGGH